MVLLGMAAPFLEIITVEQLRQAIAAIFARKGEAVVEANLKAFDMGAGRVERMGPMGLIGLRKSEE